jgi:predicted nucleic acid-binding protein
LRWHLVDSCAPLVHNVVIVVTISWRMSYAGKSNRLLAVLQEKATPIIVPTLVLPEVAAAVARGQDDAELARRFAATLSQLPHLVLVAVDETLAQQAADLAAQHRLRGSDAVYAAVALRFGSTLVTLDKQQHERVAEAVTTRRPAEALAEMGG